MYLRLPDSLALSRALVLISCLTISNRSSSIASPAASLILIASSVAFSSASTFLTAEASIGVLGVSLSEVMMLSFHAAGSTAPAMLSALTPFIRASEVSLRLPLDIPISLPTSPRAVREARISMVANACCIASSPSLPFSRVRPRKSFR